MAHHEEAKAPQKFEMSAKFRTAMIAMIVIGFGTFAAGAASESTASYAWNGYLIGFWFTMSLAMAGPFINSTQFLAIAGWSVSVRRIGEAFGMYIPVCIFLFLGLYMGGSHLYAHWWDPAVVMGDPILAKKADVLSQGFFAAAGLISLVAISAVSFWMRSTSLKQDESGDAKDYPMQKAQAAMFLVTFVTGFSFLAWICLMSLQPHWFSTMWQVYAFAGLFQSGLALMVIILLTLKKRDYFGSFVGERQTHDLGQLLFGFTVFYAYIGFCQFLLIWYANIPEEGIWYITRSVAPDISTGWGAMTLFLPIAKFIVPFFVLLPQEHKKNKNNILLFVACWLLFMQLYEVWYWVAPTPHDDSFAHAPHLPWMEGLIAMGFIGAFGLTVGTFLGRASLVPTKDPFVHESIDHHHHGVRPPEPKEIKIS